MTAEEVAALVDRIAELERIIAIERQVASAGRDGWEPNGDGWTRFYDGPSRHVRPMGVGSYIGGQFTEVRMWCWSIDTRVNGFLMRGRGGVGYADTAYQAMKDADATEVAS